MPGKVKKQGNIIYLNAYDRWYQYDETKPPLGAGAMGVVYVGEECQTHEPVAVKRVVDHYANNPEIRRRAHQEADLMFSHPNLVEMLGCCEVRPNEGPIFIISRFVKGENIDKFINAYVRALPNAEHRICELFLPVLDALAYIHSKGIIHMDIKPSNILLEEFSHSFRLTDFDAFLSPESPSSAGTEAFLPVESVRKQLRAACRNDREKLEYYRFVSDRVYESVQAPYPPYCQNYTDRNSHRSSY